MDKLESSSVNDGLQDVPFMGLISVLYIGYQVQEQYRLWTNPSGKSPISLQVQEEAWRVLHKAADENAAINF